MLLKWVAISWNSWNGIDALETLETSCALTPKCRGTPRVSHEKIDVNFEILRASMRALETLETQETLLKHLITLETTWNALEMSCYLLKLLTLLKCLKHLIWKHDWIWHTLPDVAGQSNSDMMIMMDTPNRKGAQAIRTRLISKKEVNDLFIFVFESFCPHQREMNFEGTHVCF